MRITYDPEADAMYVRVAVPGIRDFGETVVDDLCHIIDTDSRGNPRGYKFLSVRRSGVLLDGLPEDVAQAIKRFIDSSSLDATSPIEFEAE